MARASRRQSLTERLKQENEDLRDAARQLLAGLTEYAKKENWIEGRDCGCESIWIGDGEGPKIARKFLGLDQESNLSLFILPQSEIEAKKRRIAELRKSGELEDALVAIIMDIDIGSQAHSEQFARAKVDAMMPLIKKEYLG